MPLRRAHELQIAVLVFVVVPAREAERPGAGFLNSCKTPADRPFGIEVLKSPVGRHKAEAICERVIGTIRRECLDWLIPISDPQLQVILESWTVHLNSGCPHMTLGPSVPDPRPAISDFGQSSSRHRREEFYAVRARSILVGLHHEYYLAPQLRDRMFTHHRLRQNPHNTQ